jgi:competence protein CoiA
VRRSGHASGQSPPAHSTVLWPCRPTPRLVLVRTVTPAEVPATTTVHRARPRPRLSYPTCHHRVHAKLSPGGVRFFAHDPGASRRCALAGESVAHHRLKLALAGAVRAAGHHASVEATGPEGRWRADVLSTSPAGTTRWAWEAQLSTATSEDIERRTARYAADGIGACWVSDRPRNWLGTAPSLLVGTADIGEHPVEAGVARFVTEECACSHRRRTCPAGRHGHWDGDGGAGLLKTVAQAAD